MQIREITEKYVILTGHVALLLEEYQDPENELEIEFEQSKASPAHYYVYVKDKKANRYLATTTFSLRANVIDISNIEPVDSPENNKLVHTSLGAQNTGVDFGYAAVKWMYRRIKQFAQEKGYDIKRVVSVTRYSGARAKNNPGTDEFNMPKTFNVDTRADESLIYECATDTLTVTKIIE